MIINTDSIKDLRKHFEPLMTSFNGCNYNTSIEAKTFCYSNNDIFSIENLKSLFPEESIQGKIHQTTLLDAQKKIRESLSYYSTKDCDVEISNDEPFIYYREKAFWMIAKEYFPYEPNMVYEHIPYSNSYFHYAVMWFFCYVFLKDGNGMIISAGAYD